jgi:diphosphomevalonate decarboxylase
VLDEVRRRADVADPAHVVSQNSFPTGAGLASSASGLAAMAVAAARAAGLDLAPAELSAIARRGSGSACRSIFGGFVEWEAGTAADGSDSHAVPLFPQEHWDLRVVVAVVSGRPKAVGSTAGMIGTAAVSPYHEPFLETVDADLVAARAAIGARDLAGLARVAERSCLRMHAAMMAADPPLIYLTPASWAIITLVRRMQRDGVPAFFTADAGPNVKVFCAAAAVEQVRREVEALGCTELVLEAGPGAGAAPVSGP